MIDQARFETFAALHVPGDPVVLYNIWDVGSAHGGRGRGSQGAGHRQPPGRRRERLGRRRSRCRSTSCWPMRGGSSTAIDPLPLTVDFESAYSTDPEAGRRNVARLAETGAVGCNFEDQVIGGEGVHPLDLQVRRIEAIRRAVGDDFLHQRPHRPVPQGRAA